MKLLKKRKRVITVLEIDGVWLKIVQAQLFGKIRKINKIIAEKIVSLSDEKISERISNLSKELEINSNFFVVSIPHQLVVIRNLELPSTNPAEIKEMVELQIGKQTPFTKDEIIYDYEILNTNAEGYSRIMLAIVHQDVVRRYFKILEAAELKTEKITLSSEGLLAWYHFACGGAVIDKPRALISVGYDKSDFTVILKNKLIFCRNISVGFSQLQGLMDEEDVRKFIEEIKHSIYAYQNETVDKEISKIIITGAEALLEHLNEVVLREKLGLSIEIIPQLKNIPESLESMDNYKVSAKNISLSSLFGFALTYPDQKINFIPPQLRIEKEVKERGKDLYLFGIYLVFILMIASSIFLGRMYNKELYLAQLKREALKVREKVDKLDTMMKEVKGIKKRTFTKNFTLNSIYEIHRVISPEIYLASISFDGKDHLTVRGTSSTMSEVFKLVETLEESKYFQSVKTEFVTTCKVEGKDLTEFEIVCPLDIYFKQQLMENK